MATYRAIVVQTYETEFTVTAPTKAAAAHLIEGAAKARAIAPGHAFKETKATRRVHWTLRHPNAALPPADGGPSRPRIVALLEEIK